MPELKIHKMLLSSLDYLSRKIILNYNFYDPYIFSSSVFCI